MSKLKDQLNKLDEREEELENNPSELAKDALLSEVIAFYDVIKNTPVKIATKTSKPVTITKEQSVSKPVEVVEAKPVKEEKEPEQVAEKVKEPVFEKVKEPVAETPKEVVAEPVVEIPEAEEKPATKKEPLIGKDESGTKASDKKILAGQFNKEPLADLRSGIPLNEKFGIIRNLFKGNASDFGDAVLKLNNAANAKEMTHYLELLSQRFEWDVTSEAYTNFIGYVNRKMMSLEPSNSDTD
jgi:hypothetical protein